MTREWRTEWLNKWLRTDNSKHCPSTVQAFDTSVTSSTHVLASKHWVRHARPFFPPDFEAAATRHDMARYGTIKNERYPHCVAVCWKHVTKYTKCCQNMPSAPLVLPVTFVILCLYESMSNCVMSCLKTWWTDQMPGDSMQGLARCQPRLGVGRRRLSKPEHSHSFHTVFNSKSGLFLHTSLQILPSVQVLYDLFLQLERFRWSIFFLSSCHRVGLFPNLLLSPTPGDFEDTSKRGLMLVHLDSAVQHIEALQLSKLLKSQDLEIWSSQTLKTSFKILLNSTVQRSFWFLWSIGWKNWGFSLGIFHDFPASISQ